MPVRKRRKVYWIDFYFAGKRYRRPVGTNKREAADALDRIKGRIASGDFDPAELDPEPAEEEPEGIEFSKAVKLYLENREAKGRGTGSARWLQNKWLPAFAGRPVASVTSEEIEALLSEWAEKRKLSAGTRNRALAGLSAFFSYCYGRRWIDSHPTERGRVAKLPEANGRTRWLRRHEVEALVAAGPRLAASRDADGKLVIGDSRTRDWLTEIVPLIVRFAVMTGMRREEICSLTRSSFEEDDRGLAFLVVAETKNGRPLVWPLEGEALALVKERRDAVGKFPAARLFPGPGGADAYTAIARYFPAVVREAGLEPGLYRKRYDKARERWVAQRDKDGVRIPNPNGVTFHSLRHSMASLALNAGVPKHIVQRMGNWKTSVLVDRYAHLADEALREAAGKVASLVGFGHTVVTREQKDADEGSGRVAVNASR